MSVEGVQSLHFVVIIVTIQKGLEEEQEEVLDQILKMTKISQSSPKLSFFSSSGIETSSRAPPPPQLPPLSCFYCPLHPLTLLKITHQANTDTSQFTNPDRRQCKISRRNQRERESRPRHIYCIRE